MFEERIPAAFWAAVLAVAFSVFVWIYGFYMASSAEGVGEALGATLVSLITLPGRITAAVGAILGVVGFFTRSAGLILTSAILYSVAAFLNVWGFFLVPSIVLGFVGFSLEKKRLKASNDERSTDAA